MTPRRLTPRIPRLVCLLACGLTFFPIPSSLAFALCPLPFALVSVSVSEALDRYVSDPIATVRTITAEQSLSQVNSALRRDGAQWMLARGAGEANKRRLIAATFALDVAGANLETQPQDVPPLVEWGCEQVRKRLLSDAERQWHVAAMALLEGVGNPQAVEAHLADAAARFPGEPRWRQARTWLIDAHTLNVHPRQPLTAARSPFPAALAAQYEALTSVPELAGDAWVHIGFLHFLDGAHAPAREAFARAQAAEGVDADVHYLAHLFSAWMAERDKQPNAVISELTAALDAAPQGHTAAVWLAMKLQLAGRVDDAQMLGSRTLEDRDDHMDPWRAFYGGDVRRWPELIVAARKAVQ